MKRAWQTAAVVLALATAQAGAVLVYRSVEQERARRTNAAPFKHERLTPRPAPELTFSTPDGSRRLSDYRGRPVLLHFWATWCPPCKAELPALLALGRELDREGGARVIALATDEDWQAVSRFFGGVVPPAVVREPAGVAAQAFEVSMLPDTYLIGEDGRVLLRFGGARDWSSEAARSALRGMARREQAP
jgi:thiol-disulfide isomerase/thioredoxin